LGFSKEVIIHYHYSFIFKLQIADFNLKYSTSVSKMTTYRLNDQGSIPGRSRIFLFSTSIQTSCGALILFKAYLDKAARA
jgi:hypothetical protein